MRWLPSLTALAGLFVALSACAANCDDLLVPDMPLAQLDTSTDLAYLATITPETYARHRANAYPKLKHLEVQLPIARDLLRSAEDFDSFRSKRDQVYADHAFHYELGELRDYFAHQLPTTRADAYDACRGASGLTSRIVRADRDIVEIVVSWRAAAGAPPTVSLRDAAVTGAVLVGAQPANLGISGATLLFLRDLDADLRWTAKTHDQSVSVWIPRFISAGPSAKPQTAGCADASKVARALTQHFLERDAKPAEVSAQAALLAGHRNSVRQLAERVVLGEEYRKRFVAGKDLEAILDDLYRRVLARKGDSNGLASNKARFRKADFATAALTFFRNAEYDHNFGDWAVPGAQIAYCPAQK